MYRVTRTELEQRQSLQQAAAILDRFMHDRSAHPFDEFIMRDGINKVLAEEYFPLVTVAQTVSRACAVRLSPESHAGPDGYILRWLGRTLKAQITCSHEGYESALSRERMRDGEITGSGTHFRGPTGKAEWEPAVMLADDDVEMRLARIVDGVRKKEERYRPGTTTLIVVDSPAGFEHLREGRLRERVREETLALGDSPYESIFVVYGQVVDRVR